MAKNWLLLNFLVRSKNYIYIFEDFTTLLKQCIALNFCSDILWLFRSTILWYHILQSVKYLLFQNVTYFISIEKVFNTYQFLLKGLDVYNSCSWVSRVWNKNYVTMHTWSVKYENFWNVRYFTSIERSDQFF